MSTEARPEGGEIRQSASVSGDICFQGRALPTTEEEVAAFNSSEYQAMVQADFVPREVHIQVSKRCNLKCVMCSWDTWQSNVGLMEEVVFERILSECRASGVRKIVFGNAQGEPFLHPRILEMLERAVAEGFWVMVSTNGTPLTAERIERLVRSGVHHIQFSFAGYTKEIYEKVYVGARWELVTANLQLLARGLEKARAQTTLLINGCYAKELAGEVSPNAYIARTKAFLQSMGISEPRHQVVIQLPHNFGGKIETGPGGPGSVRSHFAVRTRRPGLCRVLKNSPGIYHDGRVTACGCLDPNGELLIGDLTQSSLADIRRSDPFQRLLKTFLEGDLQELPLCAECDVPYYETPDASPFLWERLVEETPEPGQDMLENERVALALDAKYREALAGVVGRAMEKLDPPMADLGALTEDLLSRIPIHFKLGGGRATCQRLFASFSEDRILDRVAQRSIRRIGLAPATKVVLDHLDWFLERYEEVYVADNFKAGEVHFGQKVLTLDELMEKAEALDTFLVTTHNVDIKAAYLERFPAEKTICISDCSYAMDLCQFSRSGLARAHRILTEIEQSANPLVVLGNKLLATAEPTFVALEQAGYDVFAISLFDKLENQDRSGHDASCAVPRNVLVTPCEQLYILTHLQKGRFWIYYDFFFNVGWDAANAVVTYASAAAMMSLASRPVVMGMYDIIKPVCLNMEARHEAFALYKVMLEEADAVVLTSKSDHIAEYLRNTLVKDRPVLSFYRYSFPPPEPLPRLSEADGMRHLVGVTSFLGEVFEPNRIETRNSIRSILRQNIHFHYYSDNPKVYAFRDELPEAERSRFHIEKAIWNQHELVRDMSRFDGGWLVGDECTLFARLVGQIEDRHIRELFSLFVPNGVPTSSMTYGAAGLPVFISRQIKVMDEVYPKGCCVPLDMGEVDNLSAIFARLDWPAMHRAMREERDRFSAHAQIHRLADFLDGLPQS